MDLLWSVGSYTTFTCSCYLSVHTLNHPELQHWSLLHSRFYIIHQQWSMASRYLCEHINKNFHKTFSCHKIGHCKMPLQLKLSQPWLPFFFFSFLVALDVMWCAAHHHYLQQLPYLNTQASVFTTLEMLFKYQNGQCVAGHPSSRHSMSQTV